MKENIETLEILRDVNDELQENHVEYERELVSEIEFKDSLLVECQKRNLIQQELVEDKEITMVKFRGLVAELSQELETIKAPLKAHDLLGDDEVGSRNQKQMLVSVNLQLHASEVKFRKLGNQLLVKNLQCTYATELSELLQVLISHV
jgi:dynactin 1